MDKHFGEFGIPWDNSGLSDGQVQKALCAEDWNMLLPVTYMFSSVGITGTPP